MSTTLLRSSRPEDLPAPQDRHGVMRLVGHAWRNPRVAMTAVCSIAGLAGLLCGLLMPRGPITSTQALVAMLSGFIVGGVSGLVLRSRWAMALAPLSFIGVYELARINVSGPTVDAVHWDVVGIIALVVGRGFHGLLQVLPMVLGAAYGAALARRACRQTPSRRLLSRVGRYSRRFVAGIMAVGLAGLAVLVAAPASTAPITGPDGAPLPGSIAELATVNLGGQDQVVMIRGHSADKPVLLFLAGGPGGTELGTMRLFGQALERRFVVATWDQRGTGKSRAGLDPTSTYTLDRIVSDTIDLTDYLRRRFAERKVYLVGNSWGTTLGVLAAQRRPELFHAFVGTGQMVSQTETDRLFMADTLAHARRIGDADLERRLRSLGQAPYEDVRAVTVVAPYERDWNPYRRIPRYEAEGEMPMNLMVDEYSLLDKVNAAAGLLDTFDTVYPQLAHIDFRTQARDLDVPIYLVQGRHEARGRQVPAREWFDRLQAPRKSWVTFDRSGHRPLFEEPERFIEVMADVVADTYTTP